MGQEQGMRGTAAVCSGQQPSQDRDVTGIKGRDVSSPCPATAQCGQTEEVCGQRAHLALPRQCVTNGATGRHTLSPQAHTCVHGLQPLPSSSFMFMSHFYSSHFTASMQTSHNHSPQSLSQGRVHENKLLCPTFDFCFYLTDVWLCSLQRHHQSKSWE